MFVYQLKIETRKYKTDEFVSSMRSFSTRIRKQKGCLNYDVYKDTKKDSTYLVVGEWKTRQALEKHFKTLDFDVLIGAVRVLGETFSMNIAEVSKTGDFELAREQIASHHRKGAEAD